MKKLLLLIALTLVLPHVYAQNENKAAKVLPDAARECSVSTSMATKSFAGYRKAAKTTSVVIASENFGTGTDSTLPTGWTAGIISGSGTWHWANTASASMYTMGAMNSTTAYNGWMIFDSDSLGDSCACAPIGWLQSPAYSCDSASAVLLSFEDYYQSYHDSCEVWVSTNPLFATYTRYPVTLNNSLPPNAATANPAEVQINITAAAALQPAVYIRFVYYDEAGQTGGYSWMIDDLSLTKLKAYDIRLGGGFMYVPDSPAYNSMIFSTPLAFLDSIYPVMYVSNSGGHTDSNVALNTVIYDDGGTAVYSKGDTLAAISLNVTDSVFRFPAFFPPYTSTYLCQFYAAFRGDTITTDNLDTAYFAVTDTIWSVNQGPVTASYYLHKPGTDPLSYFRGTRFDVPPNCTGDTISGFGVAFSATSVPTQGNASVSVQLYSIKQNALSWAYVGTSVAKPVILTDISTLSGEVWDYFRIDPFSSGGAGKFVLQPGTTYAAIVQTDSVTTKLSIDATTAPQHFAYTGYFGLYDTSGNDGLPTFNPAPASGLPTAVPMIQLYFGTNPVDYSEVKNVKLQNYPGTPYPDPAADNLIIPFTLAESMDATISLADITGQIVKKQTAHATGGQQTNAVFTVSGLPDGVYIYSVEAGGWSTNGRVAIMH